MGTSDGAMAIFGADNGVEEENEDVLKDTSGENFPWVLTTVSNNLIA